MLIFLAGNNVVATHDDGQYRKVANAYPEHELAWVPNGTPIQDGADPRLDIDPLAMEAGLAKLQLQESDIDCIRIIEDLIGILESKGVMSGTDLPEAARAKLAARREVRSRLK